MSFDNHLLCDDDYKTLLGVSIDQFIDLNQHVTSMRNTKERTIRNAIDIFLFKTKCGLSNALIATLFGFSSRRQVARIIQQTRTALVRDFVPLHLGFSHFSSDTRSRSQRRYSWVLKHTCRHFFKSLLNSIVPTKKIWHAFSPKSVGWLRLPMAGSKSGSF